MPNPEVGDQVVYMLIPNGTRVEPKACPAIVLAVWDQKRVNLVVFVDGPNDVGSTRIEMNGSTVVIPFIWATTIEYNENKAAGTWHHRPGWLMGEISEEDVLPEPDTPEDRRVVMKLEMALYALRGLRDEERSDRNRYLSICITEMEKVFAYFHEFIGGRT